MVKLCALIGATAGGYAGWALGALAGPFTAFAVSMVGTGIGLYCGRRVGQHYQG
jgi:membrane protein YqaA with SNARE-associated domain